MSAVPWIIIGAGGHAAVVADTLLAAGERVLGFTDLDPARHGQRLCELPVLGDDGVLAAHAPERLNLANGIGGVGQPESGALRQRIQQRLAGAGWRFPTLRHPSALVSPFAHIDEGAQLLAACVVQPAARIGEGAIINTAAVVEHDTQVGPWTHVAPRALLCGAAVVGANCHVGAGAVVLQGLRLAAGTVVGAGAVVVRDVEQPCVLAGVPARTVQK